MVIATKTYSNLLEGILGRQTAAVLSVLLARPGERLYQRRIMQLSGLRLSQVQRELQSLTALGVVELERDGNRVYYHPSPTCPILPELTSMVVKTTGIVEALRVSLTELPGIVVAFVYGSFARGEQTAASDVDVMVIGEVTMQDLVVPLRRAEEQLGREVNASVYPAEEFRQKIAAGNHFLTTVISEPKLYLIGGADVLEQLARTGLAQRS